MSVPMNAQLLLETIERSAKDLKGLIGKDYECIKEVLTENSELSLELLQTRSKLNTCFQEKKALEEELKETKLKLKRVLEINEKLISASEPKTIIVTSYHC